MIVSLLCIILVVDITEFLCRGSMATVILSVENLRAQLLLSLLVSVHLIEIVVDLCCPCLSCPISICAKSSPA